jgi:hypothetical protein
LSEHFAYVTAATLLLISRTLHQVGHSHIDQTQIPPRLFRIKFPETCLKDTLEQVVRPVHPDSRPD